MNRVIKGFFCVFSFLWILQPFAAQTLTGTVHNETTGKAAVGDEVVLVRLGEGMEEEARTKTDAEGAFKLNVNQPGAQHFVRVIHQGVNYDQTVNGSAPLQVVVYDAVSSIPGLSGTLGIVQTESDGKFLKVTEMYVLSNASNPPVTQARANNYEISLPDDAALDSVDVRSGRGIWVRVAPTAITGRKHEYGINFPIRPGETLFKFTYHMPYQGRATLHLHLPYPIARFGIMHPRSMRFKQLLPNTFNSPGSANGLDVEAAVNSPLVGDVPPFEISGVGKAPEHGSEAATRPQQPAPPTSPPPPASNPAAGHSPNVADVEDKSRKELWPLIGGIIVMLAILVLAVWRIRKRVPPLAATKSAENADSLLEALKEELFQLESDRVHESISAEEYEAAKDALNQSIQRALARRKN